MKPRPKSQTKLPYQNWAPGTYAGFSLNEDVTAATGTHYAGTFTTTFALAILTRRKTSMQLLSPSPFPQEAENQCSVSVYPGYLFVPDLGFKGLPRFGPSSGQGRTGNSLVGEGVVPM